MNLADLVILVLVGLAVFFALRRIKKNKGGCGCGCDGCSKKHIQKNDCGKTADHINTL